MMASVRVHKKRSFYCPIKSFTTQYVYLINKRRFSTLFARSGGEKVVAAKVKIASHQMMYNGIKLEGNLLNNTL